MKDPVEEGFGGPHGAAQDENKGDHRRSLDDQGDEENAEDQLHCSGGGVDAEAAGEEDPLTDFDPVAEEDHGRRRRRHHPEAAELDEEHYHPLGGKGQVLSRIHDDESRNADGRGAGEEGVKKVQGDGGSGVESP